jgi:hypothetical protein
VDGTPVSLPIPTDARSPTKYYDLREPLADFVEHLTNGRIARYRPCHLDPDIDRSLLAVRPPGWLGALGQVSAAQAHLEKQSVGPGDLFLFWGLFRNVELRNNKWRFFGVPFHAIFGWLQIERACRVGSNGSNVLQDYPWLSAHPHARDGWSPRNTIYIARRQLSFMKGPGFGTFKKGHRLTMDGSARKSLWHLPRWLDLSQGGTGMTYHSRRDRWMGNGLLQAAARGQEFVADLDAREDAVEWIRTIIEANR